MDILEAIQARHSVRDFAAKPVPKELVMKIMQTAICSPSSGNGQPWEVFIASGATLEKIRQAYLERAQHATPPPPPSATPPPPPLPDHITQRFATVKRERLILMGYNPDDPASQKVFTEMGTRLYNAPVLVVICIDKAMTSLLDIGLFIQTLCLAATGYGVDSLIASWFIAQPDILREMLEIPENLHIAMGVGLGYANPEAAVNTYRSPRRPIEEVVRYKE